MGFYGCGITELSVPNSLEIIENSAFGDCNDLIEIKLPSSLKFIGSGAFHNCKNLKEIIIPMSVKQIASGAFSKSGLKEIIFKGSPPKIEGKFLTFGVSDDCILKYPKIAKGWDNALEYERNRFCGLEAVPY